MFVTGIYIRLTYYTLFIYGETLVTLTCLSKLIVAENLFPVTNNVADIARLGVVRFVVVQLDIIIMLYCVISLNIVL